MARRATPLNEVTINTKSFKIEAMIVEKNIPRIMASGTSSYQRLVLQDVQGTKIQATIFGNNIQVLGKTLKLHHTYRITNPSVTPTPEAYRFLPHLYQLGINARTPIEQIHIDSFTARTLQHNFISISELHKLTDPTTQIDVLFAVLEVGPKRQTSTTVVANVRIVDQSFHQTIISMWDQFAEYEASTMANMPDQFPVVIAHRLKTTTYCGLTLATRPTSSFTFQAQVPEAIALQAWCIDNATKIKGLPPLAAIETTIAQLRPPDDAITKIANIPTAVSKPELFNIHGVAKLTNLNQSFYYITCSSCKKSSNAYGDTEYWCNHCEERVKAIPKLKFSITITDPSAAIEATIFQDAASDFYSITPTVLMENLDEDRLSHSLLEKLSEPRECTCTLKVSTYSYANNTQHRVTVQTITGKNLNEDSEETNKRPLLCSDTPTKRSKTHHDKEASGSTPSEQDPPAETNSLISSTEEESSPEINEE